MKDTETIRWEFRSETRVYQSPGAACQRIAELCDELDLERGTVQEALSAANTAVVLALGRLRRGETGAAMTGLLAASDRFERWAEPPQKCGHGKTIHEQCSTCEADHA